MKYTKNFFSGRWGIYFAVTVVAIIATSYFHNLISLAEAAIYGCGGYLLANSDRELKQLKRQLKDNDVANKNVTHNL
ncbi:MULTISPECIES: hypothetical protein [Leuconostoc]|jgi:hypothetical protein|uniref:Uncharacterized protein n=1 Tax=Leuconostoc pseudomesenteroides TaxID=33968 RepID=A0A5B8SYU1_LEUPS|nr:MULTISPECIES: hypothetical protein [Leuconostoc]MBK0040466.1 hypothetical protein [Leuconostoc sp. S51]MBK0051641.1 hypothetical protein [Leuconostoc sp. S50]MBS0958031.1 hypothetical protein [Leuconostoc pseudomesenteroides]MCC8440535.1 hypothetical protein [Leuconostoc pseudomesenteroides]MCT4379548.1 hypothetical protein [Leuconostoc pseudomesenteroides]